MASPLPATPDTTHAIIAGAAQKYGMGAKLLAANQPADFTTGVLKGIGAPVNPRTVAALEQWRAAEGGPADNPLNTTLGGTKAGQGYGSVQAGVQATVQTLKGGQYGDVIQAFKESDPAEIHQSIIASPWSENHYAGTTFRAGVPQGVAAPTSSMSAPRGLPPPARNALPAVTGTIPGVNIPPVTATVRGMPQETTRQSLASLLLASNGRGLTAQQLLGAVQPAQPVGTASLPGATTGSRNVTLLPGTNSQGFAPGVTPTGAVGDAQAGATPAPPSEFARMVSAMNEIAGHHYSYEWGGGHNPTFTPTSGAGHGSGPGIGYDCSGAISAILHSAGLLGQPMVAQQFMTYGQAGPGGQNDLTIYASPTHVFAELGGRFFGTSLANPGGGADWFQRAETAGYTIRHVSLAGAPAIHMTPAGGLVPFRSKGG